MNKEYTETEIKDFIKTAKTEKEIEGLEFALLALQNNEKHDSDFYTAWIEGDKHIENIWICFDRQIEIRIHIDEEQEDIYFIIYYHEGNKEAIVGLDIIGEALVSLDKTEIFNAISEIKKCKLNYKFDVIQ